MEDLIKIFAQWQRWRRTKPQPKYFKLDKGIYMH